MVPGTVARGVSVPCTYTGCWRASGLSNALLQRAVTSVEGAGFCVAAVSAH